MSSKNPLQNIELHKEQLPKYQLRQIQLSQFVNPIEPLNRKIISEDMKQFELENNYIDGDEMDFDSQKLFSEHKQSYQKPVPEVQCLKQSLKQNLEAQDYNLNIQTQTNNINISGQEFQAQVVHSQDFKQDATRNDQNQSITQRLVIENVEKTIQIQRNRPQLEYNSNIEIEKTPYTEAQVNKHLNETKLIQIYPSSNISQFQTIIFDRKNPQIQIQNNYISEVSENISLVFKEKPPIQESMIVQEQIHRIQEEQTNSIFQNQPNPIIEEQNHNIQTQGAYPIQEQIYDYSFPSYLKIDKPSQIVPNFIQENQENKHDSIQQQFEQRTYNQIHFTPNDSGQVEDNYNTYNAQIDFKILNEFSKTQNQIKQENSSNTKFMSKQQYYETKPKYQIDLKIMKNNNKYQKKQSFNQSQQDIQQFHKLNLLMKKSYNQKNNLLQEFKNQHYELRDKYFQQESEVYKKYVLNMQKTLQRQYQKCRTKQKPAQVDLQQRNWFNQKNKISQICQINKNQFCVYLKKQILIKKKENSYLSKKGEFNFLKNQNLSENYSLEPAMSKFISPTEFISLKKKDNSDSEEKYRNFGDEQQHQYFQEQSNELLIEFQADKYQKNEGNSAKFRSYIRNIMIHMSNYVDMTDKVELVFRMNYKQLMAFYSSVVGNKNLMRFQNFNYTKPETPYDDNPYGLNGVLNQDQLSQNQAYKDHIGQIKYYNSQQIDNDQNRQNEWTSKKLIIEQCSENVYKNEQSQNEHQFINYQNGLQIKGQQKRQLQQLDYEKRKMSNNSQDIPIYSLIEQKVPELDVLAAEINEIMNASESMPYFGGNSHMTQQHPHITQQHSHMTHQYKQQNSINQTQTQVYSNNPPQQQKIHSQMNQISSQNTSDQQIIHTQNTGNQQPQSMSSMLSQQNIQKYSQSELRNILQSYMPQQTTESAQLIGSLSVQELKSFIKTNISSIPQSNNNTNNQNAQNVIEIQSPKFGFTQEINNTLPSVALGHIENTNMHVPSDRIQIEILDDIPELELQNKTTVSQTNQNNDQNHNIVEQSIVEQTETPNFDQTAHQEPQFIQLEEQEIRETKDVRDHQISIQKQEQVKEKQNQQLQDNPNFNINENTTLSQESSQVQNLNHVNNSELTEVNTITENLPENTQINSLNLNTINALNLNIKSNKKIQREVIQIIDQDSEESIDVPILSLERNLQNQNQTLNNNTSPQNTQNTQPLQQHQNVTNTSEITKPVDSNPSQQDNNTLIITIQSRQVKNSSSEEVQNKQNQNNKEPIDLQKIDQINNNLRQEIQMIRAFLYESQPLLKDQILKCSDQQIYNIYNELMANTKDGQIQGEKPNDSIQVQDNLTNSHQQGGIQTENNQNQMQLQPNAQEGSADNKDDNQLREQFTDQQFDAIIKNLLQASPQLQKQVSTFKRQQLIKIFKDSVKDRAKQVEAPKRKKKSKNNAEVIDLEDSQPNQDIPEKNANEPTMQDQQYSHSNQQPIADQESTKLNPQQFYLNMVKQKNQKKLLQQRQGAKKFKNSSQKIKVNTKLLLAYLESRDYKKKLQNLLRTKNEKTKEAISKQIALIYAKKVSNTCRNGMFYIPAKSDKNKDNVNHSFLITGLKNRNVQIKNTQLKKYVNKQVFICIQRPALTEQRKKMILELKKKKLNKDEHSQQQNKPIYTNTVPSLSVPIIDKTTEQIRQLNSNSNVISMNTQETGQIKQAPLMRKRYWLMVQEQEIDPRESNRIEQQIAFNNNRKKVKRTISLQKDNKKVNQMIKELAQEIQTDIQLE